MSNHEEKNTKRGIATAGLVLGIIGVCTSFMPIINNLSFIMGIIAVIFGLIAVKKAGKGKIVATIILGVLAIVFTINAQQELSNSIDEAFSEFNQDMDEISGNSTEKILENDAEVVFGTFQVSNTGYFTETKLDVKVKNKSLEKKSFSIHIEAVDSNGSRIADDYVYVNDLGAEQTQNFEAFNFVDSDKVNSLKNATFKIVEISMY